MPPGRRKQHHLGIRHRLKHLRAEQKLNPTELGRKAGLSRTAVSHIEVGRGAPGVDTIEDLAYALGVPPGWLAFGDAGTVMQETHKIAPGFDPIQLADEIAHLVNGCGGVIGTKFLYFEPSGASDWRALVDVYRGLPIELAIPRLVEELDHSPIDVIGLGVGTCHHETNLVMRLLEAGVQDIRFFLLDISQALLSVAYQYASDRIGSRAPIVAIAGDFEKLPHYMHYFDAPPKKARRRLVTMFGYTFGNLDNEVRFLQSALTGFRANDLFLLDVSLAFAPSDNSAQIKKKDPALAGQRSEDFNLRYHRFLTGPLRRHAEGLREIKVSAHLDTASCTVPGSYAIDKRATVKTASGSARQFSVGYTKRYDPGKLQQCLTEQGWQHIDSWRYGGDFLPAMLGLFKRQA